MIETIAGAVLGGAGVFGLIYLLGRIEYWKGEYDACVRDLDESLGRLAQSSKDVQALENKHEAVMSVFRSMGERPVVAAITDAQIQKICENLALIALQSQSASRIN